MEAEQTAIDSKKQPALVVAIAGNPNCGKTTLFNALTGLRYKVANYPGVTVERKIAKFPLAGYDNVTLVDLPGIYSLAGTSVDEKIATAALLGEIAGEKTPDLLLAVVDSSNLERNLYLLTQLMDSSIPIVVVLTMGDIAESKGIRVFSEILSRTLDLPVVSVLAKSGKGLDTLSEEIGRALATGSPQVSKRKLGWLDMDSQYAESAKKLGAMYAGSETNKQLILVGANLLSESLQADSKELNNQIILERRKLQQQGIDPHSFEATERYKWINKIVKQTCVKTESNKNSLTDRLDVLLTHRIWGSIFFVGVMSFIFQSIFLWAQAPMELIDSAVNAFASAVSKFLPQGQIQSLIVDGVIAGVGNVIIFIPQIAILFFFLGLLEDSGYLARAAFLMDKVMRPFGLQGRSFIPLLSSFACAIPGILSTRTIPSWSDRMATIMVAPLMSCSARLPVYTVLIAAFVPAKFYFGFVSLQALVLLSMYLLGIVAAAAVAYLLKILAFRGKPAIFVMELPTIRRPSMRVVVREVVDRVNTFLKSAGTMILACSIILWFLASYPRPETADSRHRVSESYAGKIGQSIEPLIKPLGFNWEIGVGILASFAAREVFISALSTVYNLESEDADSSSLIELLKKKKSENSFTTLTAISLMVFYVFACQCMSTLAVCRRETGSWAWTAFMFFYMTTLAYIASYFTFNIGKLFLV